MGLLVMWGGPGCLGVIARGTVIHDTASRMTAIRENGATSGIGVLATYTYDNLGRRSAGLYHWSRHSRAG